MKNKLLNEKTISPACTYCVHGRLSPDKLSVLCIKKGVMLPTSSCRRFIYDPLKRQPQRLPRLPKFNAEDFEL
ncbi:MAG: hypothetical protein WCN92_05680 [Eubacteriales bacterium]